MNTRSAPRSSGSLVSELQPSSNYKFMRPQKRRAKSFLHSWPPGAKGDNKMIVVLCHYIGYFLKHFIELWLTCKKLCISNVRSLSLGVSIHHETITLVRATDTSATSQSFLPRLLLLLLCVYIVRTLNRRSTFLANFKYKIHYCSYRYKLCSKALTSLA